MILVLEWLSALALLGREPDAESWTTERKLRYLLKVTSVDRSTASFVYLPLLPAAFFWSIMAIIYQEPYWPIPAVIGLIDLGIIVAFNEYIR